MQKENNGQRGDALVYGIGAIVVIVAGLIIWRVATNMAHKTTTASTTSSSTASTVPSMSTGTDNASLQTDLNSVNGSINQEQQDSSNADTAINDQQNQVVVPTD